MFMFNTELYTSFFICLSVDMHHSSFILIQVILIESTIIRQYLEVDYPKLVRLYGDLWRRLEGITVEMMNTAPDLSPLAPSSNTSQDGEETSEASEQTQHFE